MLDTAADECYKFKYESVKGLRRDPKRNPAISVLIDKNLIPEVQYSILYISVLFAFWYCYK